MMRALVIAAVVGSASCAAARPKPPVVIPKTAPLPEFADGADAARMLEAKVAVEAARLRWFAALEEFERKYHLRVDMGDGWDEEEGGKLRIRRAPPNPPVAGVKK